MALNAELLLTAGDIENIVNGTLSLVAEAEVERTRAIVSGHICSCCDAPLPADYLGRECAACVALFSEGIDIGKEIPARR